jgi:hypothetical protein
VDCVDGLDTRTALNRQNIARRHLMDGPDSSLNVESLVFCVPPWSVESAEEPAKKVANGGKGVAQSLKARFGLLMCRRELAYRNEESRAQG